jgi:hypothetical protein
MIRLCALALLVAGCEPRTVQGTVEKYGPAARAKLDALGRVANVVKAAPPVGANHVDWPADAVDVTYEHRNIVALHIEELDNLSVRPKLDVSAHFRSPWVDVASVVGVQQPAAAGVIVDTEYKLGMDDPHLALHTLKVFGGLRYAIVVRRLSYDPPEYSGAGAFKPGHYSAEALVFDLAPNPPKQLGGFRFESASRASVGTAKGRETANLNADLTLATAGALVGALQANTQHLKAGPGSFDLD